MVALAVRVLSDGRVCPGVTEDHGISSSKILAAAGKSMTPA